MSAGHMDRYSMTLKQDLKEVTDVKVAGVNVRH